ncbi:MAG: GMC family oxidoreductase [Geminicoccaceae bacterium]
MILDSEKQDARALLDRTFDVCICGAGPAGISLALRLAEQGKDVVLLEAGGLEYEDVSQELYQGESGGLEYFDLDITRVRQFGGSSNHWGGWIRELEPNDYLARPQAPMSGWPIRFEDVDAYTQAAGKMIEIEDLERIRGEEALPYEEKMEGFESILFTETKAVNFGEKYRQDIEKSQKIVCLYNCNVLDLVLDDSLQTARHAVCAAYENPDRFEVRARYFVVSMGGIENARFLLNANNQIKTGIGNERDNVGRYFSEHTDVWVGSYFMREGVYNPYDGALIVTPDRQTGIDRETLRYCLYFGGAERELRLDAGSIRSKIEKLACQSDIGIDIWRLLRWRRKAGQIHCTEEFDDIEGFPQFGQINVTTEQALNPASRVTLADQRDRFGLRRTRIEWNLTELDYHTLRTAVLDFGEWLAGNDIGRVRMAQWLSDEPPTLPSIRVDHVAHHHHMCTTRMADDPQFGVVDANCKVFGTSNIYMAGSSVFATGGFGNPTYDLVKIALRLGDHLASLA